MIVYNNTIFDSVEEVWFAKWCNELQKAGYIASWKKVTDSMTLTEPLKIDYTKETQLKTKKKVEVKSFRLLEKLSYTMDFDIDWTPEGFKLFVSTMDNNIDPSKWLFSPGCCKTWVEIKPVFDQNNMTRDFKAKQKIIWDKYKIFVNLIFPNKLFEDTFVPLECIEDFKFKKIPSRGQNIGKLPGDWKTKNPLKILKEYINGK